MASPFGSQSFRSLRHFCIAGAILAAVMSVFMAGAMLAWSESLAMMAFYGMLLGLCIFSCWRNIHSACDMAYYERLYGPRA